MGRQSYPSFPTLRSNEKNSKAAIPLLKLHCPSCAKKTLHLINNVINETAVNCLACPNGDTLLHMVETIERMSVEEDFKA